MLTTECSNPHATNAVIGKTVARILSVTLRAPMHSQTARQTSTLQRTPRTKAETGSRAILLRAIRTIVSPTAPSLMVCTPASHTNRMPKKSVSFVLASLRGSTYRNGRLASSLAAALLDGLFEHPAKAFFC